MNCAKKKRNQRKYKHRWPLTRYTVSGFFYRYYTKGMRNITMKKYLSDDDFISVIESDNMEDEEYQRRIINIDEDMNNISVNIKVTKKGVTILKIPLTTSLGNSLHEEFEMYLRDFPIIYYLIEKHRLKYELGDKYVDKDASRELYDAIAYLKNVNL